MCVCFLGGERFQDEKEKKKGRDNTQIEKEKKKK